MSSCPHLHSFVERAHSAEMGARQPSENSASAGSTPPVRSPSAEEWCRRDSSRRQRSCGRGPLRCRRGPANGRNRREGVIGLAGGDGRLSTLAAPVRSPQFAFRNKNRLFRARDRWFESISLQRRVLCESDFLDPRVKPISTANCAAGRSAGAHVKPRCADAPHRRSTSTRNAGGEPSASRCQASTTRARKSAVAVRLAQHHSCGR